MIEQELIKIWQSSPNEERIKFEKSRLLIEAQANVNNLHKSIKARDLREYLAIIIIIPACAFAAFKIPFLLSKVASVLIVLWCIYIAIRLRNTKKRQPTAFTESYLDYLHKTREYILIQKRLIDNVLYWYILPGMTLTILFFLGFATIPGNMKRIIVLCAGNILLALAVFFMNKAAVNKIYTPQLKKIEELIKVMEQD